MYSVIASSKKESDPKFVYLKESIDDYHNICMKTIDILSHECDLREEYAKEYAKKNLNDIIKLINLCSEVSNKDLIDFIQIKIVNLDKGNCNEV
jgi:hypothetical protein